MAAPLGDLTNLDSRELEETSILRKNLPFPPSSPCPTSTPSEAAQPPPPLPEMPLPPQTPIADMDTATAISAAESPPALSASILQTKLEHILPVLKFEHPHSRTICAIGHVLLAMVCLSQTSFVTAGAWSALLMILFGGVVSTFQKSSSSPALTITTDNLQPLLPYAIELVNLALRSHHAIFRCGNPRSALIAAVCMWVCALSGLDFLRMAWLAFTAAFAIPSAQVRLAPQIAVLHTKLAQAVHQLDSKLDGRKQYVIPFLVLGWFHLSYTHKALSFGFGCIAFKAWQEASPSMQGNMTELNKNAGAALDKIKKRARRMTIASVNFFSPRKHDVSDKDL